MRLHKFQTEFSSDFMRWSEIYTSHDLKNHKVKENDSKLDAIQETIIKNNDPGLAFNFACDIGYKIYLMQNVILRTRSAKYATLFAQNIVGADITSLQNIVLDSKNMKYICTFAHHVKGVDKNKIEAMILADKNVKGAHILVKHVGSNPNKFKKLIMASGKPRYLYELAKHLTNKKDLKKIQELIIKSKSPTYARLLAQKFPWSDVEALEQVVLDSGDVKEIKKFALSVKRSMIRNFTILF